jgi:O-antigen/teichoic acid export membrane protein
MSSRLRGHLRPFAWVGVDQVFSSLSNMVVAVAIARSAGATGLGRYSVAFACYLLVLGFQRQLVTEPLLSLRWRQDAENTVHDGPAMGAALLYLAAASLATLGAGLATGRGELVALALLLPGVCLQDFGRYVAFRRQRQRLAAGLDALWVALSALSCAWILRSGSPVAAVVGWGLSGGVAAVYGAVRLRLAPARPSASIRWWQREARQLGGFLTLAGIAYIAGSQGMLLAIAVTLGEAALGQLRQAQILLGPAAMSIAAFGLFVQPRLARREQEVTSRTSGQLSLAATLLALAGAATSLAVAAPVSELLFRDPTAVSVGLLLPLSVQLALEASALGFVLPLRAARRGAPIAAARAVSVAVGVPAVIGAASLGGIVLAAWAFAAQAGVYLVAAATGWTRTQQPRPAEVGPR